VTPDARSDACGFPVSTGSVEAANAYALGVDRLLERSPEAITSFRQAIELDPQFEIAWVALACALTAAGMPPEDSPAARVCSGRAATRRERQHIEILRLALGGDEDRAAVLGREHLREFPSDLLVAHVLRSHGIA
jgi:hypothetical protein